MSDYIQDFTSIPVGPLGIIACPGTEELAKKVDSYLVKWRAKNQSEHKNTIAFSGYERETYIIKADFPRFGTGEGKGHISETVRGYDIYIFIDAFNYGVTYKLRGIEVPLSPDEHYANLKRAIASVSGKARRITVIMPMLYEGRQHRKSSRESLDCAMMLQELCTNMGVDSIITFDAHDARVQNAIPLNSFENFQPAYQMMKALVNSYDDLKIDRDNMMIISPDEGGMSRCIYYATVLELELGMFYKRRDYSKVVNGRNPIVAHEFLGSNISGKDVIIVDDMISSAESMIEVAKKLKELGANRIFVFVGFSLFTSGLEIFDKAYEDGIFNKIFATNTVYLPPEVLSREWFKKVDMSKYLSYIVDTLNHDKSISGLLDPSKRIYKLLGKE